MLSVLLKSSVSARMEAFNSQAIASNYRNLSLIKGACGDFHWNHVAYLLINRENMRTGLRI